VTKIRNVIGDVNGKTWQAAKRQGANDRRGTESNLSREEICWEAKAEINDRSGTAAEAAQGSEGRENQELDC
jgi:hypothetical protein